MNEELSKEFAKTSNNSKLENKQVVTKQKELILNIFENYKKKYGEKAIDSILYGLAIEAENMQERKDKINVKVKK